MSLDKPVRTKKSYKISYENIARNFPFPDYKFFTIKNYWSEKISKNKKLSEKEEIKREKRKVYMKEYQKKRRAKIKLEIEIKEKIDKIMKEVEKEKNKYNRFEILDIE